MYKKYGNVIDLCNDGDSCVSIEKTSNLNFEGERRSNSFMDKTSDKEHIKQAIADHFGVVKDFNRSEKEQLKYDRAILKNLHKKRTCLGMLAEDIDG